jgi:SAM-dependent methyltransferase
VIEARPRGWKAYDAVADAYDESAAPLFRRLANDLVAFVAATPGSSVLDLGTGTGFTAEIASPVVAPDGFVVGVDPSYPMLAIARRRVGCLVGGLAPGLPFRASCFDAVLANLVLSHFPKLDIALNDVMRVIRPGGMLGASAWADANAELEDDGMVAGEIVTTVLEQFDLATAPPASGAPSEATLRIEAHLHAALVRAGLAKISIEERTYGDAAPIDRYVRELDWISRGRYLHSVVDEDTRARFRREVTRQLATRFPEGIRRTHSLRLAVGTKRG